MNPLAHSVMGLSKVFLRLKSVLNFTRILNFTGVRHRNPLQPKLNKFSMAYLATWSVGES